MHTLTYPIREKNYEPIFSEIDIWTRQNEEKYSDNEYKIKVVDKKGKAIKNIDARLVKKDIFKWDEITHEMAGYVMGIIQAGKGFKREARRGDMMMDLMVKFRENGHRGLNTTYVLLTFEAV